MQRERNSKQINKRGLRGLQRAQGKQGNQYTKREK
jgi:hypothetical protein